MIVNGLEFKRGFATAQKLAWKGVRRNNYVKAERFASVKRVRIAEDAGSVAITCSDMQATAVTVSVALAYDSVYQQPEAGTVWAKDLLAVLKHVNKASGDIRIAITATEVIIRVNGKDFEITRCDDIPAEYLYSVGGEYKQATFDVGKLQPAIANVIPSCSEDFTRHVLTTVCFNTSEDDGRIEMAATDSYRLSVVTVDCHSNRENAIGEYSNGGTLIYAKTLQAYVDAKLQPFIRTQMHIGNGCVRLQSDNITINGPLCVGEYVKYRKISEAKRYDSFDYSFAQPAAEVAEAIREAGATVGPEEANRVAVSILPGQLKKHDAISVQGFSTENCDIEMRDHDLPEHTKRVVLPLNLLTTPFPQYTCFNYAWYADFVERSGDDCIITASQTQEGSGTATSIQFTGVDCVHVLMPMGVDSNGGMTWTGVYPPWKDPFYEVA